MKATREYIKRWNGKHPVPYDFFFTFDDAAKEDLSWFWAPWFFEAGYPDLGIDTVYETGGKVKVHVTEEGKIPTSVAITFKFTDGTEKSVFKNCSIWKEDDDIWIEEPLDGKRLSSVILGSKYIPDLNKENNVWEYK
jgi:aminopeptidase N